MERLTRMERKTGMERLVRLETRVKQLQKKRYKIQKYKLRNQINKNNLSHLIRAP